jgi:hypothetical protein
MTKLNFFQKLALAFKAFCKTWDNPEKGQAFITGSIPASLKETSDPSHLRLLAALQLSGRLIDFLKEDITSFDDAQVGAAVRKIHEDCSKSLEDLVTIRPVMDEKEGALVNIPRGYNPSNIKVVGKVKGEPPFSGIIVHRGWKAHKRSLPKQVGEQTMDVICPAEIEVR